MCYYNEIQKNHTHWNGWIRVWKVAISRISLFFEHYLRFILDLFVEEYKDIHGIDNKFYTWILYNCSKWAILMKFRMIKPAGSARYAYEKVAISRISLFFEHYLRFILDLFVEEYKDIHGIDNKFHTWILYNCCKWAILMKFRIIKPTGWTRYAYEKVASFRILQISTLRKPLFFDHF